MKLIIDGLTASTPTWRRGIGKVFRNLLRELLFHHRQAEIVITCTDPDLRDSFPLNSDRVAFHVIDPALLSLPPGPRAAAYSAEIEALHRPGDTTLFWHPNPLMSDQVLPYHITLPSLLTVYDLIPFANKEMYLSRWPREIRRDYLRRLDFFRRPNVHLAPISQSVADQVAAWLPMAAARTRGIPIGYDEDVFRPPAPLTRPEMPGYVILVSGDDPRKNIPGFVRAFCAWRRGGGRAPLKIICELGPETRAEIETILAEYRDPEAVEITGFVPDQELGRLTRHARLAVMPSLNEGFGLPILEAMASGVPVACSDIPPSREIGGDLAVYFDPASEASMLAALQQALQVAPDQNSPDQNTPDQSPPDRDALQQRARKFTWQRAGIAYRRRIQDILDRQLPDLPAGTKVAMLTPWPPHRSGIAVSAKTLAEALAPHLDLTIVCTNAEEAAAPGGMRFASAGDFDPAEYELLICQLGNNLEMHDWIYDHALARNALAIAHDTFIHPFLQHGHRQGRLVPQYRAMLANHFEAEDIGRLEASDFAGVGVLEITGLSQIARHAGGLHLHSSFARGCLLRELPAAAARISTAPLVMSSAPPRSAAAPPDPGRFTIGMFGHVTRFKLPGQVLQALQLLLLRGLPVELRIVGNLGDEAETVHRQITRMALAEQVTLIGYADSEAFERHIAECDAVINLRHPTHGESSGVVFDAMRIGVPVVVSNGGSFAELPDDAVVKVQDTPHVAAELAQKIEGLLTDPSRRAALAARARLHISEAASIESYTREILRQLARLHVSA